MNAPRWFYVVIATSVAVVAISMSYRALRPADEWVAYQPVGLEPSSGFWFLNTRTHVLCVGNGQHKTCFDPIADSTHH